MGAVPAETRKGPDQSTSAPRTFNFDLWTSECMGLLCINFAELFIVIFDDLTLKRTLPSKRNQPNKSTRWCYSICLLFQIKKKRKKPTTNLSLQWYGTRGRKENLCFVKTLVKLHLVSRSIVLTVSVQYICVRVSAWRSACLCAMYVSVCMYRHSISDLSTPPTQLSLGEERP